MSMPTTSHSYKQIAGPRSLHSPDLPYLTYSYHFADVEEVLYCSFSLLHVSLLTSFVSFFEASFECLGSLHSVCVSTRVGL